MGLARLDDAEYARRARERNNRINAAHRQRLLQSGKAQTNVWLSAALRTRLDGEAATAGVSLSAVVERLLSAALASSAPALANTLPVSTLPLFAAPAPVEDAPTAPVDRDSRILALKREQPDLSNYAIAAQVGCSEPTVRRALKRLNLEATV